MAPLSLCRSWTGKWDAYLAGGAAAALQLGHRRSVDFDWFTRRTLAPAEILADLRALKLPVDVRQNTEGTFLANVGKVEFSVFRYPYGDCDAPFEEQTCGGTKCLGRLDTCVLSASIER